MNILKSFFALILILAHSSMIDVSVDQSQRKFKQSFDDVKYSSYSVTRQQKVEPKLPTYDLLIKTQFEFVQVLSLAFIRHFLKRSAGFYKNKLFILFCSLLR